MSGERLTTWPEVQAYLSATFGAVTVLRIDLLTIVVDSATIEVQPLDEAWLKVTCVIGSLRLLSPVEMLAHNVRAVIGTFCTRDGQLAVRQTLPVTGLVMRSSLPCVSLTVSTAVPGAALVGENVTSISHVPLGAAAPCRCHRRSRSRPP